MAVGDGAVSGEKCRLNEVLTDLFKNKDQHSIKSMEEGVKEELKESLEGIDAAQMKVVLKAALNDIHPEVLPNVKDRDKAIDDIVKDILDEVGIDTGTGATTKSWEDIKKEKSKELEKFVEEVNKKNDELIANDQDPFRKAAIMFDSKNPSCQGMAVPGNYKENPFILNDGESFNQDLFEGRFKSNYEDYYNYLMTQDYLENLPEDFYKKKGLDKDKSN